MSPEHKQLAAEPALRVIWSEDVDAAADVPSFVQEGDRITRWTPVASEPPTDCYRIGEHYWLWRRDFGSIRFNRRETEAHAYRRRSADPERFRDLVLFDWVPHIHQFRGLQVLHASAAVHLETGRVVAFTGNTGAGKSTLAYALGIRGGWRQVADDTLSFRITPHDVRLAPLLNESRLRPPSIAHFGLPGAYRGVLAWPGRELTLIRIYFASPTGEPSPLVRFQPLVPAQAYPMLLEQSWALALTLPEKNQRLMSDYLGLVDKVPTMQLEYFKNFDVLSEILDAIEAECIGSPAGSA